MDEQEQKLPKFIIKLNEDISPELYKSCHDSFENVLGKDNFMFIAGSKIEIYQLEDTYKKL